MIDAQSPTSRTVTLVPNPAYAALVACRKSAIAAADFDAATAVTRAMNGTVFGFAHINGCVYNVLAKTTND